MNRRYISGYTTIYRESATEPLNWFSQPNQSPSRMFQTHDLETTYEDSYDETLFVALRRDSRQLALVIDM